MKPMIPVGSTKNISGSVVHIQSAIHSGNALICFALLAESLKMYVILKAMCCYDKQIPSYSLNTHMYVWDI